MKILTGIPIATLLLSLCLGACSGGSGGSAAVPIASVPGATSSSASGLIGSTITFPEIEGGANASLLLAAPVRAGTVSGTLSSAAPAGIPAIASGSAEDNAARGRQATIYSPAMYISFVPSRSDDIEYFIATFMDPELGAGTYDIALYTNNGWQCDVAAPQKLEEPGTLHFLYAGTVPLIESQASAIALTLDTTLAP